MSTINWTYLRAQEELEGVLGLVSWYFEYVRTISGLRKSVEDHGEKFCKNSVIFPLNQHFLAPARDGLCLFALFLTIMVIEEPNVCRVILKAPERQRERCTTIKSPSCNHFRVGSRSNQSTNERLEDESCKRDAEHPKGNPAISTMSFDFWLKYVRVTIHIVSQWFLASYLNSSYFKEPALS